MVTPLRSQSIGLVVSAVLGFAVYLCSSWFFKQTLDFWHLGEILSYVVGIPLGTSAAYTTFTSCLREVPINSVGIITFLGSLTENEISQGRHWVPPFIEVLTVPSSNEKFILEIPGEKIGARDGVTIHFGTTENGGKANQLQYSIVDPQLYILTNNPDKAVCEAYMEAARLFFRQMERASGVRSKGRLFLDFINFDANDTTFEDRLRSAEFKDGDGTNKRLFSDEAVRVIMKEAGKFAVKIATWGIGNAVAFIPSIHENRVVQKAAEKKQVAEENAKTLDVTAISVTKNAKEMADLGVTTDLALIAAMKMSGEGVVIEHKNLSVSGVSRLADATKALDIDNSSRGQRKK